MRKENKMESVIRVLYYHISAHFSFLIKDDGVKNYILKYYY